MLRKHGIAFSEHPYDYEEHGGTTVSARELGVDEHGLRVWCHYVDSGNFPVPVGGLVDSVMSMLNFNLESSTLEICPCAAGAEKNQQQLEWTMQ
jgi:hypothetical protein